MNATTTSNWANDSTFLQNIANDTSDWTRNNSSESRGIPSYALLLMCAIGLPGNLLVIAVYATKMTTSTRVYLFALAVVDSLICVCGIVVTTSSRNAAARSTFVIVISLAVIFSVLLLVFVSIERCIAVIRPHSFSVDPKRAKLALVVIAVVAACYTTMVKVANAMGHRWIGDVFKTCIILFSIVVMITCYTLIAASLCKRVRASRNEIGVLNATSVQQTGTSRWTTSTVETPALQNDVSFTCSTARSSACVRISQSAPENVVNKMTAAQVKKMKGLFLLFTITVVFVALWLPEWFLNIGVYIPPNVRRIYLLNSVVNPFIYAAISPMFREDVRQFYSKTRVELSAGCC